MRSVTIRSITAAILVWAMVVTAQQAPPRPQPASPSASKPAGQAQPGAGQKGPVKFDITTQLVVEDVILKDKNGQPITNLTAKDFAVTEDGKPQDVKICEFQKLEEQPAEALADEPQTKTEKIKTEEQKPDAPKVVATEIAPERPGDIKYKDKRLMVMFFDMVSMPIQDQVRALDAATKFVKTQITASDLVAIMVFASDIKVVEDFTDDRDLLLKDIKHLTVGEGQGFDAIDSSDAASDSGDSFTQDDTEFAIFNTDRQLSALETAVKMLASLNEKKALVYFSSGIQRSGQDNQAQLQATVNAAIRSNVSFYPIDARGLVAQAPLGDATKGSPGGSAMYSGSSARASQSNFQAQQETLYTLATDTGGKLLIDNSNLTLGIVQAQKDISSYYILGYYTTNEKLDGHFRRVKISLKDPAVAARVPKLDYRQGYWAGKDFKKFDSTDKERQLDEALMMGDPITDMDLALDAYYFRLARDRYFVPVVAKIPGSELELAKKGGVESTTFDFIGVVKDSAGKIVQNVRDYIPFKLKEDVANQLSKHPIVYPTGFTLPPGTYSLRLVARENTTGRIGTFDKKLVIPDLTTEQARLPISSVILSSQRMDIGAAVFSAQKDKKIDAANPLIEEGKELIPSVTNVFSKTSDMYVYLQAYEPAADSTQPLVATVTFYRGRIKAFETAPLEVTEGLDTKSKAMALKFSLPLSQFVPGRYTCQVNVLSPDEQKWAIWRSPVMLVP
jgi:VWFA-related protein